MQIPHRIRAFSFRHSHFYTLTSYFALLFHRVYNAPLPNTLLYCLSFGVRFSPVKFSAQRRSTSELLRTL